MERKIWSKVFFLPVKLSKADHGSSDYEQKTFFLGNIPFEEAHVNATLVVNKLTDYLKIRGVQFTKVYGFGSDGASLMTGKKTGVATQIKDANPHCLSVHCFAHRLALCTEKAATL